MSETTILICCGHQEDRHIFDDAGALIGCLTGACMCGLRHIFSTNGAPKKPKKMKATHPGPGLNVTDEDTVSL